MDPRPPTIGAFELLEQIGAGGMGTIWRARHTTENDEVAIKLVTAGHVHEQLYRDGFRREVEAVAGLSHVGIVAVYDYGEVGELAASGEASEKIVAGTPWLAMEYATLGNLDQILIESWAELRVVLYDVLDALAHAHSRGVIHRDLKPANILTTATADGELLLKLSDFGIAQLARDRENATEEVAGTPIYMAPEQFAGRAREQGPWTDLYALGVMTFESLTGEPPFDGTGFFALARAHMQTPIPEIVPRYEVPAALLDWVRRLLAKAPEQRFEHAADARWALQRLDPLEGDAPGRIKLNQRPDRDFPMRADWQSARTLPLVLSTAGPAEATDGPDPTEVFRAGEAAPATLRPPIPPTWSRNETAARTRALLSGVGLGLFGLRPIPFVGREAARDVIWQALRAADRDHCARAVVVRGPAGCGKSRLAEWIAQRAVELGAAQLMPAFHDSMGTGISALRASLAALHRCDGLSRHATYERLRGWLDEDGAAAATQLLLPDGPDDDRVRAVEFGGDHERYLAADLLLDRGAYERPLIVWIDDAQWGAEMVSYALHVLQRDARRAVLFVLTVRAEAVHDREREADLLRQILADRRCELIEIEPLNEDERRRQVERMLRLPEALVQRVAERSEGNPLFAVQLVGDWVQRGALVRGERGFELRSDAADVPDDIHALWLQRLDDLERRFGQPARDALRVAAALGDHVAEQMWRLTCEAVGVVIPPHLVQSMVTRRLATRVDRGFRFAHRMFRESVERDAREADVWTRYNRAAAAICGILWPRPDPAQRTRTALYLLEAGLAAEAIDELLQAGAGHLDREELGEVEQVLGILERAIGSVDEHDERRGLARRLRWQLYRHRGQFATSDQLVEQLLQDARTRRWRRVEASALFDLGSTVALYDDARRGRDMMFQAVELFDEDQRERRRAAALKHLSHVYGLRGNAVLAAQFARDAFQLFTGFRDTGSKAWCLYYLGLAQRVAGDVDDAERRLNDALEQAEHAGLRDLQANCHNVLADLRRMGADFDAAAQGYERAQQIWASIGSANVAAARFNVGMIALQRAHFDHARQTFDALSVHFDEHQQRIPLAATHVALVACASQRDDTAATDEHIAAAQALLEETGLVDPDVLVALDIAANWLHKHHRTERRLVVLRMAQHQIDALG